MNSLNKVRVPVAVGKSSKIDLPEYHQHTTDFFVQTVAHYHHMIPGERYKCPSKWFTRLSPLSVPTFGNIAQKLHCFFVPYRLVMRNWSEFKVDTLAYDTFSDNSSLVSRPTYFSPADLTNAFIQFNNFCVAGTATDFDFQDSSTSTYYKLTSTGVRALALVESLGYKLFVPKGDFYYNAIALLSLARLWYDWFSPSAYQDSFDYLFLKGIFESSETSGRQLSDVELNLLLQICLYVNFNDDYFTLQWDNPVAPNNGIVSNYDAADVSLDYTYNTYVSSDSIGNHTPYFNGRVNGGSPQGTPLNVTQYIHTVLESMTNYLKRYQLVGSRVADRALAELGFTPQSMKLDRSYHLKSTESIIQIGDVMSHAGTSDNALGDYAGQGSGGGECLFEYVTDESGIFIITSSLIPEYGYFQGFDRHNVHMDRLEFWNGNYDNLGVQSTLKGELYVSDDFAFAPNLEYAERFGYAPRYAEYKFPRNFVTGLYRLPSWDAGGSSWHLNRMFSDASFANTPANMVHSQWFMIGRYGIDISNAEQFDRIFDYTGDDRDHFNQVYFFGGTSYSPAASVFDSFDWGDDEDNEKVTLQSAGSKLN